MKLDEYLGKVEKAKDRQQSLRELCIKGPNQRLFVGGTFNDLIYHILQDNEWNLGSPGLEKLKVEKGKEKLYEKFVKFKNEKDVKKYLEKRAQAYQDWNEAPDEEPKSVMRSWWKGEIEVPKDSISFYHPFPTEASLKPINDVNIDRHGIDKSPYDCFKTDILLNGGFIPEADSSAQAILYFGKYALNRTLPFAVSWGGQKPWHDNKGYIILKE